MAASSMTDLEGTLLARVLAGNDSLPDVSRLSVRSRENTGVGRYTHLDWVGAPFPETHVISPPDIIEMDGVAPEGLGAVVFVGPQELTLELFAYVGDWDGTEGRWSIKESAE